MSYKFLPICRYNYINIYFIKEIYYDSDDSILYFSIYDEDDCAYELIDLYNDDELCDNIFSILKCLGLYNLLSLIQSCLNEIQLSNNY